jgi:NAD(P)-dependent dehydrogenase (short-subunit alcohol dehydrogenase family)
MRTLEVVMDLGRRVALITGGGTGIGLEIAMHLAQCGMAVAVAGRSDRVDAAGARLANAGRRSLAIRADVTCASDVAAMFEQVEAELGPTWLLVNNAGVLPIGSASDTTEDDWDLAMSVIAKGTFLCSQAAIKRMVPRGGGRIVNVSSISSVVARSGQIAYCAAKAAVNHLTRCLAMEVAPHGITVNALLPGSTAGEMLAEFLSSRGIQPEALVSAIPHGRLAKPADHAALVAFLASDEAAHITGQVIAVDGGQAQYMPFR